jgi:hypothetical protein
MTTSTVRTSRRGEEVPPLAGDSPTSATTTTDRASADPSNSPDQFAQIAAALQVSDGQQVAADLGPQPPQIRAGQQAIAAAGWVYNQAITHLFSYDSAIGVWVYVNGVGWKRFSPNSEHGITHMTAIATMATHNNLPVHYHEDAAGLIDQIYA